jgi:hypothetical protein
MLRQPPDQASLEAKTAPVGDWIERKRVLRFKSGIAAVMRPG